MSSDALRLTGPGYRNVDATVIKTVDLGERGRLQFRAEAFNLLNRANLDLPDIFMGSPAFGKIQSAQSPRRLQFGLKLPTGRFDQNFSDGPAAGSLLDRGLQLGTGTTDLLAGVSWFARPVQSIGVFVQGTAQQPLAGRDGFIPSASITVSGGVRWLNFSRFTPQLQLNVKAEGREHGAEADTPNSGGVIAYLSPGVTAELTAESSAFVFVQLPVYQRVNGLQLEPHAIVSIGLRYRL